MFLLVLIFFDLGAFERHWSLCYHDGDWSDESVLARLLVPFFLEFQKICSFFQKIGRFLVRVSKNL